MIHRLAIAIVLLFSAVAAAEELSDQACLDCHGVAGFAAASGEHGGSPMRSLDISAQALAESVHGKLACVQCHEGIAELPHGKDGLQSVDCVSCHDRMSPDPVANWRQQRRGASATKNQTILNNALYQSSVHADAAKAGNAGCNDCHTAHYVYRSDDPRAATHRLNSPEQCGRCHAQALAQYRQSLHGANLKRPWAGESATCSDCHDSHRISGEAITAHRVATESCGNCHESEVDAYMATTHGQLAWLGNPDTAKCANCHGGHDIHAVADPASRVNADNKLETCRQCHEQANASFIQYYIHGNTHDFGKYPGMWLTAKFMVGIVILVLIFFYSHSMLWFYREARERLTEWRTHNSMRYRVRVKKPRHHSEHHYRRFTWPWRLNHWALALSVMTLVATGMSVMYSDSSWAADLVAALGGQARFTLVHRFAAVVFMAAVIGHVIAAAFAIRRNPRFEWFGPDSLLPRWKDWHDMVGQFRWFLGRGQPPRFDRWTYWEKFDYWAVYWGALVIGLSGFMLWFSDAVGSVLPGWVLNMATIAHGVEAFLAVMTLFTVHFFNNHFRPSKFPLDTVMFTGSWDLEEFKEERPEEYRRLEESGELAARLVAPPSRAVAIISHLLGFTLLGFGLVLLVLVTRGFLQQGLV